MGGRRFNSHCISLCCLNYLLYLCIILCIITYLCVQLIAILKIISYGGEDLILIAYPHVLFELFTIFVFHILCHHLFAYC